MAMTNPHVMSILTLSTPPIQLVGSAPAEMKEKHVKMVKNAGSSEFCSV